MSPTNQQTPNKGPENRVISYHKIRLAVGIIGMALPFSLWLLNTILNESGILKNTFWISFENPYHPAENLKDSISHFYYSSVGELFTGALCAVALFLFCYKGYDKPSSGKYHFVPGDSFMCNLAAAMALLVVIFPTSTDRISDNFRAFVSSENAGYIHYAAAVLFFFSLSVISFVNFRRTKDPKKFGQMQSHPIYKTCAIIMLSSMFVLLVIFLLDKLHVDISWADTYNVTFWLETVMLVAFGFSWLVKGEIDQEVMNKNYFGNGLEKKEEE